MTQLVTEEELNTLFVNQIEREIFRKILERLVEVILDRTSLHALKLHIE